MKLIILLPALFSILLLTGCGDSGSKKIEMHLVPSTEIENFQIIQDNGNVSGDGARYIEYDYSKYQLSADVLHQLYILTLVTETLYCSNDGVTYEMNITDSNGEVFTYVSNNRDCGREDEEYFISVTDVEYILSLID